MDLTDSIVVVDMGYYSLDLLIYLESHNINYIFRLRKDIYIDERYLMQSNDEELEIQLNSNRLQNIKDEKLKKKDLKEQKTMKRFVNLKIKTRDEKGKLKVTRETLLTNLTKEFASPEELKNALQSKMANRIKL